MAQADPNRDLAVAVRRWYRSHARDLPWRAAGTTPWQVLVSEVMLAQTPVARVAPAYEAWITRWPDAAATAAASPAEILRQWDRLGYPRRAVRLREAAVVVTAELDGAVPRSTEGLRSLPGVGEYTAAAVQAFAYGQRVSVLDVNVRRVIERIHGGSERPGPSLTRAERERAESLLPARGAPEWSVAVMELGALVCTSRRPACGQCPVRQQCAWRAAGYPVSAAPARRQAWHGTDRQCRGRIMADLRAADGPLPASALAPDWPDPAQRERCLDYLLDDGLAELTRSGRVRLPSDS